MQFSFYRTLKMVMDGAGINRVEQVEQISETNLSFPITQLGVSTLPTIVLY